MGADEFANVARTPALPWRDRRFVGFFAAAALGPIASMALRFVPGHLEGAGHSPAIIGEVMAASTLGGVVALPLAGWLAQRRLRAMLVGGALVQALGLACAGASADSVAGLAASVALMSLGTAHLDVGVVAAVVASVTAERRPQVLAYYFAFVSLARNVIGSGLAEGLLGRWGFASMCRVLAALAAVHVIVRAIAQAPTPAAEEPAPPYREFLRDFARPRVLVLVLVFTLLSIHFVAQESFITALATHRALGGVTPLFTAYFAVIALGRAAAGHLVDRLGRGPVVVASALLLVGVGAGLAEVRTQAGMIALGVATGLGHLLLWPALYSTFYDKVRGRGMVSAALSAALAAAGFLAELGLGGVASRAGYAALYWTAAGCAGLAAVLALPLSRWMAPRNEGS
ncbi:Predicted arabinose efflux permease, MFS family [Nannocystis exedens]|uniref:Predicted arabinose efflux permease, MFS family n=1 Tax=Nannocystis exedens TaxID=54 RepID=A0A1I2ELX2_9BACT|nr:MFS transporter [Nannocystis exedens]PCC73932.1 Major Facilitator Superfamily protein [Nannocystis exedens]SFE94074.1 Predicted arabinose efflux permease, MFS family [Nannocystis exedens]